MAVKVELGFSGEGVGLPYFTLDDPVLGVLDNPDAFLGIGEIFVDVSSYFKALSINRGKSRELDRYQAGQASIVFDNTSRVFDPTFTASPFFGQIVPKRQVRITVDNIVQYLGVVEDWNISYEPTINSNASLQAFDSFSYFANAELGTASYPIEDTSVRLNNLLDTIGWSTAQRMIDSTSAELQAQTIQSASYALPVLQNIAISEPGDLFIAKNGDLALVGRNKGFSSGGVVFSDAGTAIPYKTISAIYGSELLYNVANVSSSAGTAFSTATSSVASFGQRTLTQETLLSTENQLQELADFLVIRYSNPEFRFEGITIDLKAISTPQRADVLDLELGDIVLLEFTPSNIPPKIERYGKIIGISLVVSPDSEELRLQLQSTQGALLTLDDPVFGKLDNNNVLGW